jgi:hypothetical protein
MSEIYHERQVPEFLHENETDSRVRRLTRFANDFDPQAEPSQCTESDWQELDYVEIELAEAARARQPHEPKTRTYFSCCTLGPKQGGGGPIIAHLGNLAALAITAILLKFNMW